MRNRKNRGFTLVELMVVIVILGILASIVAVNVAGTDEDANKVAAEVEVKQIYTALCMYKMRSPEKDYPEDLAALVDGPPDFEGTWRPLFPSVPKDPWQRDYEFEIDDNTGLPIVRCLSKESSADNKGPLNDIVYPKIDTDE